MEGLNQAVDIFSLLDKAYRFAKSQLTDNVVGEISIIISVSFNTETDLIRVERDTHVAHDAKSNFLPVLAKSLSSFSAHSTIRESMSPSIGLIAVMLYYLEVSHTSQSKYSNIEGIGSYRLRNSLPSGSMGLVGLNVEHTSNFPKRSSHIMIGLICSSMINFWKHFWIANDKHCRRNSNHGP